MDLLEVQIPVVQFVPLRRAQPEQVLAMDVFSRGDKLVAEEGTELDQEKLDRFENFGVRQVVVEDHIQRWVRADRREDLPSGANVLGQETVQGPLEDLLDVILDAILPRELQESVQLVLRRATLHGLESARVRVESLADRTASLMDDFADLRRETEELDNERARETILDLLDGPGLELGYTLLDLGVRESLMKRTVRAVNDRETVRSELIREIKEWDESHLTDAEPGSDPLPLEPFDEEVQPAVEALNDGRVDEALDRVRDQAEPDREEEIVELRQSLEEEGEEYRALVETVREEFEESPLREELMGALNGSGGIHPKTLTVLTDRGDPISRDYLEFLTRRFEDRDTLWRVLNEVTDGVLAEVMDRSEFFERFLPTPESSPESVHLEEESFEEILEETRRGHYCHATQAMIEGLAGDLEEGSALEGQLMMAGESFERLEGRREELIEQVRDEVPENERDSLVVMLKNPANYEADRLLEVDADMVLLESIESHVRDVREAGREFLDLLDRCAPPSHPGTADVELF